MEITKARPANLARMAPSLVCLETQLWGDSSFPGGSRLLKGSRVRLLLQLQFRRKRILREESLSHLKILFFHVLNHRSCHYSVGEKPKETVAGVLMSQLLCVVPIKPPFFSTR